MKINTIFNRFLQVLVLTGSSIFGAKTVSAQAPNTDVRHTINDRINNIREGIRNNPEKGNLAPGTGPHETGKTVLGQIWINIVPLWHNWNKMWNDWSNWNNWQKWTDWNNYHREHEHHDRDHYDRDHHDNGRGHDKGHDNGHGHKR